ncbi:MAG: hypothetical protein LBH98_08280 [Chitinispirillales bacterium]|nr:hypothetical protein [Chitinispirillales bacterium]
MDTNINPVTGKRLGKFLWKDKTEQEKFLFDYRKKIAGGFYSSELVLISILDEISPVLSESVGVKPIL